MAWMIVSDSSCDIRELTPLAPGVQFALVPFKIRIGQREYVDLPTLKRTADDAGNDRLQRRFDLRLPEPGRMGGLFFAG